MTPADELLVEAGARALARLRDDHVFTSDRFMGAHWDGDRDVYRADAAAVLNAFRDAAPKVTIGLKLDVPAVPPMLALVEFRPVST